MSTPHIETNKVDSLFTRLPSLGISSIVFLVVIAAFMASLGYQQDIINQREWELVAWQEAARPALENRGIAIHSEGTAMDLANALNPCFSPSHLGRGVKYQVGCNDYSQPIGPVFIQVEFLRPEDRELLHYPW